MLQQITFQCLEIAERALRRYEPQFHQRTRRVVNEDEQGAGIAPILEPSVVRPVDLDQLTEAFSAQSGLMERPT